jgi:hypothetical protein
MRTPDFSRSTDMQPPCRGHRRTICPQEVALGCRCATAAIAVLISLMSVLVEPGLAQTSADSAGPFVIRSALESARHRSAIDSALSPPAPIEFNWECAPRIYLETAALATAGVLLVNLLAPRFGDDTQESKARRRRQSIRIIVVGTLIGGTWRLTRPCPGGEARRELRVGFRG